MEIDIIGPNDFQPTVIEIALDLANRLHDYVHSNYDNILDAPNMYFDLQYLIEVHSFGEVGQVPYVAPDPLSDDEAIAEV